MVLCGDGAFLMLGMEVHTAVDLGLPILFVVFNNAKHGMCVTRQQVYFQSRIECASYDSVAVAEALPWIWHRRSNLGGRSPLLSQTWMRPWTDLGLAVVGPAVLEDDPPSPEESTLCSLSCRPMRRSSTNPLKGMHCHHRTFRPSRSLRRFTMIPFTCTLAECGSIGFSSVLSSSVGWRLPGSEGPYAANRCGENC